MRRQDYLRPLLVDRARAGRPGPAGDPDRADRRPVVRPGLPGRHHHDPRGHPIYRWECVVRACERTRTGGSDLCTVHQQEWAAQSLRRRGQGGVRGRARGLERPSGRKRSSAGSARSGPPRTGSCGYASGTCPGGPLTSSRKARMPISRSGLSREHAFDGYGTCAAVVCPNLAESPLGLCPWHSSRYRRDGSPGGGRPAGELVEAVRRARQAGPGRLCRPGGLPPLVRDGAGPAVARPGQPPRPAAPGEGRDPVGTVRSHPAGPADPAGPGLDPLTGRHLPRHRTWLAGRPGAQRRRPRSRPGRSSRRYCTSCGWSTSPRTRRKKPGSWRPSTSGCCSRTG